MLVWMGLKDATKDSFEPFYGMFMRHWRVITDHNHLYPLVRQYEGHRKAISSFQLHQISKREAGLSIAKVKSIIFTSYDVDEIPTYIYERYIHAIWIRDIEHSMSRMNDCRSFLIIEFLTSGGGLSLSI